MQIGDTVRVVPQTLYFNLHDKSAEELRPMTGRICYIHPQGRFYVVEFTFKFGSKVRESFDSRPKYRETPVSGARGPYRKKVK